MDFEKLSAQLAPLKYPEVWVTRSGLVALLVVVLPIAELAALLRDSWKPWQLLIVAGVALLTTLAWWLGRSIYWRIGSGRKVGISCDAYKLPMDDWIETRRQISLLCESFAPEQKVHLKLLPVSMTSTEHRWEKAERRFSIPLLFRVVVSPSAEKPEEPIFEIQYRASFGARLRTSFVGVIDASAYALLTPRKVHSLKEALRYNAANLFDMILLYLGVIDFAQGRRESAAVFLNKLDQRISDRFAVNQHPRSTVRWLRSLCLVHASIFPGDKPPEADDLIHVTALCRQAVEAYGSEFPHLFCNLARDLYYLKDLTGALEATDQALASAGLSKVNQALAQLHRAVLTLFLDRYEEAAQSFGGFFQSGVTNSFDWSDLINFADFAYEYGHKQAVFIKVLYRKVSGATVPKQLGDKLSEWIVADPARNQLGLFYHTGIPGAAMAIPPAPKNPSGKRKSSKKSRKRR